MMVRILKRIYVLLNSEMNVLLFFFYWPNGCSACTLPSSMSYKRQMLKKIFRNRKYIMLRLHHVPGGHGRPVYSKRSVPWNFGHIFLCFQDLLRLGKVSYVVLRYS